MTTRWTAAPAGLRVLSQRTPKIRWSAIDRDLVGGVLFQAGNMALAHIFSGRPRLRPGDQFHQRRGWLGDLDRHSPVFVRDRAWHPLRPHKLMAFAMVMTLISTSRFTSAPIRSCSSPPMWASIHWSCGCTMFSHCLLGMSAEIRPRRTLRRQWQALLPKVGLARRPSFGGLLVGDHARPLINISALSGGPQRRRHATGRRFTRQDTYSTFTLRCSGSASDDQR